MKSLIQRSHADKSKTFKTCPVSNKLSAQQKKKCYKKKLSYKKAWEKVYPWVQCEDPRVGMFCRMKLRYQLDALPIGLPVDNFIIIAIT